MIVNGLTRIGLSFQLEALRDFRFHVNGCLFHVRAYLAERSLDIVLTSQHTYHYATSQCKGGLQWTNQFDTLFADVSCLTRPDGSKQNNDDSLSQCQKAFLKNMLTVGG